MSKTAAEIINKMGQLMGDNDDITFTRPEKLDEINTVNQDRISSDTLCFSKTATIQVRDKSNVYEFPEDLLQLKQMSIDELEGELVLPTTYNYLIRSTTGFDSNFHNNPREAEANTRSFIGGVKIYFRDLSPDNEFIFDPKFDGEKLTSGTAFRQPDIPTSANEKDVWIDTFNNQDFIFISKESYSIDFAKLTVSAPELPGGTDLVFQAITIGVQYINVAFINAGASGTSSKTITGSGTRSNPLLYTFNLFEDNNSNNAIISLLSGDTSLSASGSDITNGTFNEFSSTPLINQGQAQFEALNIFITYYATLPILSLESDELHPSIPTLIRTSHAIAYLAASGLIDTEDGGNKDLVEKYEAKADEIISKAIGHRNKSSVPHDVVPG